MRLIVLSIAMGMSLSSCGRRQSQQSDIASSSTKRSKAELYLASTKDDAFANLTILDDAALTIYRALRVEEVKRQLVRERKTSQIQCLASPIGVACLFHFDKRGRLIENHNLGDSITPKLVHGKATSVELADIAELTITGDIVNALLDFSVDFSDQDLGRNHHCIRDQDCVITINRD